MMNVKKQAVKSKETKQQQVRALSNEQLDNINGGGCRFCAYGVCWEETWNPDCW